MSESTEPKYNRREYTRIDVYIPFEFRVVRDDEHGKIRSRISGEVMLANFSVLPPLENHPQSESLILFNKKLDTIIQMFTLQNEGFHSLPFKFITLSGSGLQFSSRQYFNLGSVLEFKMILTLVQPIAIYAYGEVVRMGRQSSGHVINVRFTDVTDAIRDTIIRFIFDRERKILSESNRVRDQHE